MATDRQVSLAKFEREIAQFHAQKELYDKMGLWMLWSRYPQALVAFTTPKATPAYVPFAALVDYTDYDAKPLTITLVHPCTLVPLKMSDVLPVSPKDVQFPTPPRIARFKYDPMQNMLLQDSILQGYSNDDPKPFLCMQGVRSYHDHPAHTGDSWWLHRTTKVGALANILNTLWKYGVRDIVGQNLGLKVAMNGFVVQPDHYEQVVPVMQQPMQLVLTPAVPPQEGNP